jgi:hypothetical protein
MKQTKQQFGRHGEKMRTGFVGFPNFGPPVLPIVYIVWFSAGPVCCGRQEAGASKNAGWRRTKPQQMYVVVSWTNDFQWSG